MHSERATELIAQLMPPPVLHDHADSDNVSALMDELIAQGDPRAAEVLIVNRCEGGIGGTFVFDALVEIGPPAVPYVLPYLLHEDHKLVGAPAHILGRIAADYRSDLGGIVEHIIIPRLKVIAADEFGHFSAYSVEWAEAALARLQ